MIKIKKYKDKNKYQEKIVSILNEPRKYSRFKGFEDEKLFDFIENKIGKIYNYAEIGFSVKKKHSPMTEGHLNKLPKNAKVFDIIYV